MDPFKKGKRIWREHNDEPNQYAGFRSCFTLERIPQIAVLRIRADNRYSATLNGEWIPAQQYSDYDFYPTYDEIEISPELLRMGDNVLDILAYCQNEDSSIYRKGEPSLIFELYADGDIVAFSGGETQVTVDTGFQSGAVERITVQLSYSFRYDAHDAIAPQYVNATVLPQRDMDYHPRPIPQLSVGAPIPAKIVAQGAFLDSKQKESGRSIFSDYLSARRYNDMSKDNNYLPSENGLTLRCDSGDGIYAIIDLHRESAGYLEFDIEVEENCHIVCGYGEHLDDLRVRASVNGRNFAFVIDAIKGRNKIFWPIKRFGGRYFEVHAACKEINIHYIGLRPVDYPFGNTRIPEGLNMFQRHIYDTSVRTVRLCAHEHYEDTPWREQALYAMDSRNQMLFCYDAFGETTLARESLRLLALGQKEHGLLSLCAPAQIDDKYCIPCFSLVWICALREYFDKTQDVKFIKEMLPYAKRIFNYFDGYSNENGLVRNPEGFWNFYEWSDDVSTGTANAYDAQLNAFYLMALRDYEKLCVSVGVQCEKIKLRIEKTEFAYREAFFSSEKQAYRFSTENDRKEVYSELTQALSILSGACNNAQLRSDILKRLTNGEFYPATTLSHRIYLYQALLTDENMKNYILNDAEARWFKMLSKGATSFWETEKGSDDFSGAGSLCHGWSAVPIWVYWNCR